MRTFFVLAAWITTLHCVLFGLFWLSNRPFHRDVNGFLGNLVGRPMEYVAVFLGFSLFILVISLMVIGLNMSNVQQKGWLQVVEWLYTVLAVVYVVFFYGSFIMLFRENPVQVARLVQFWWYFRLLADGALLAAAAWVLGGWVYPALSGLVGANWGRLACLGGLLAGWLLPALFPPGNIYRGSLPVKPLLIAHRGASWLAPENTLAAMERAVDEGAYGLETDVHISQDGILFLMHDQNLKRTTDAARIYPGREADHASSFTWDELSRLNAGAWFAQEDPYGTIASGMTSREQAARYEQEGIPKLESYLDVAKRDGKVILYDLYDPPEAHPFHGRALEVSLGKLKTFQLGTRAWVLAGAEDIPAIESALPEATLVAGIDSANPPQAESLSAQGFQVVNSEYSLTDDEIGMYKRAGLWVNLYTVDDGWQFSRLWIRGANSVTSNNIHNLQSMKQPVMGWNYSMYLVVWLVLGLLAAALLWIRMAR